MGTASCAYRGALATQEIDDEVAKIQQKMADDFVTWIPNNIKSSLIEIPPEGSDLATQFGAMYKRKAFLHWYKGEGMDEMEFQEADKNVRDLITEYQDKQDAVVDLDGDDDDDDDDDEDDDEDDDDEDEDEEDGDDDFRRGCALNIGY